MLVTYLKQFANLSDYLSFTKNGLEVTVEISTSIIQLLQGVIDETYNAQQNNGQINIKVDCRQATPHHKLKISQVLPFLYHTKLLHSLVMSLMFKQYWL